MNRPLRRHFMPAGHFPHFRQVQRQRTRNGGAAGAIRQTQRNRLRRAVKGARDIALIVAVEVDLHFGTIGEAEAVVFIHFIQDTGVPAVAPFVTFQVRDLGIGRQTGAGTGFTGVALNFRFGVHRVKADAEAEVII